MKEIKNMIDIQSLQVDVDDFGLTFRSPIEQYPKNMFWLFSACYEYLHTICPGDCDLRRGFSGSCVCSCHR